MADYSRKIILFAGAPLSNSLDWKEEALCAPLQPCFSHSSGKPLIPVPSIDAKPVWRYLHLEQNHLPTGLTQASRVDMGEESSFLSTENLSFSPSSPNENSLRVSQHSQNDVLSQFYERSFALHEEIPSSQIIHRGSSIDTSSFTDTEDTSLLSNGSIDVVSKQTLPRSTLSFGHLIDLRDVPNAAHIRSIEPQTMTVNLIVGIISVPQPRLITTRKARRKIELVEMLVGDDTKAGFGVNVWLHPNGSGLNESGIRSEMAQLRLQDVVLMKNVALTSFRGKVYGQSLRKNATTLDLLYRNVLDFDDRQGAYTAQELVAGRAKDSCVAKIANVKQWAMSFVGTGITSRQHIKDIKAQGGQRVNKGPLAALPPDTQT